MDRGYGALSSSKKAKGKEKAESMEASKTFGAVEGEDNSSAAGGPFPGDVEPKDVWAEKMLKKIDDLLWKPHDYTTSKSISIVLASTEDRGKKLYEPRAVAIGPYHRKTEDNYFSITDEHKLWCVALEIGKNYKQDLGKFLGHMKERGNEAWKFYENHYGKVPGMDPQSFLEMLMLDSFFILFALEFRYDAAKLAHIMRGSEDALLEFLKKKGNAAPWAQLDIVRASEVFRIDLLLHTNQIPFFILEDVFKMKNDIHPKGNTQDWGNQGNGLIRDIALKFFDPLGLGRNSSKNTETGEVPHHLLHLYHMSLEPTMHRGKSFIQDILQHVDPLRSLPSATELQRKYAVDFKVNENVDASLEVTTSKDGHITMPALRIYDHTSILLHNLIAFERTPAFITDDVALRGTFKLSIAKSHITAYVEFMDHIVRGEEDVELLQNSMVLEHRLTSPAEVVALFRQLHYVIDPSQTPGYLAGVYKEVFRCCDSKWRRIYADGRQRYCSNVWLSISFVAGMALSVLTLIETIYAIIGFYQS